MTNIVVTGARGMLGRALMPLVPGAYAVSSLFYDLQQQKHIDALFRHTKPDVIFHLAANVGGISHNINNPVAVYYDNILMNTQLIEKAARSGVKKFIFISSVCTYPKNTSLPTREEELFTGRIEPSNESYGWAKLVALIHLEVCKKTYGMDFSYPILANLYGPYDRGFTDPARAHLIPNLVRKFCAQPDEVVMFGDGTLTRDMLYVGDAAEAILRLSHTDYDKPFNIATGREVSKRTIQEIIVKFTNFKGKVTWDGKPDKGELRRCYDVSRAKKVLNWQAKVDIEEGLQNTIEWWTDQK